MLTQKRTLHFENELYDQIGWFLDINGKTTIHDSDEYVPPYSLQEAACYATAKVILEKSK